MFAGCSTLEAAIFFSMIFVNMSLIKTKTKQLILLKQMLKPQTVTVKSFCLVMRGLTMSVMIVNQKGIFITF